MPNPVVHFEIQSADAEKTQDVLPGRLRLAAKRDASNGLRAGRYPDRVWASEAESEASEDGQSHVTFYIEVDDAQAYLDKAVEAGGQEVVPVTVIPGRGDDGHVRRPGGRDVSAWRRQTSRRRSSYRSLDSQESRIMVAPICG